MGNIWQDIEDFSRLANGDLLAVDGLFDEAFKNDLKDDVNRILDNNGVNGKCVDIGYSTMPSGRTPYIEILVDVDDPEEDRQTTLTVYPSNAVFDADKYKFIDKWLPNGLSMKDRVRLRMARLAFNALSTLKKYYEWSANDMVLDKTEYANVTWRRHRLDKFDALADESGFIFRFE